jgi:hypothetical protein
MQSECCGQFENNDEALIGWRGIGPCPHILCKRYPVKAFLLDFT